VKFLNESVAVSKKDIFALCRKERIPLSIMLEKVKTSKILQVGILGIEIFFVTVTDIWKSLYKK
jgi:hypothetical protein